MAPNTTLFKTENKALPIGDIPEIHECLQSARKHLALPPIAQPSIKDINSAAFQSLLMTFPPLVTQYRDKYRCVGNIRMWEICRNWLEPDQKVPVRVVIGRFNRDFWERNQVIELFYGSVIYGLIAEDAASLYQLSKDWPTELGVPPLFPSKAAYGRAMRVGKGRMNRG